MNLHGARLRAGRGKDRSNGFLVKLVLESRHPGLPGGVGIDAEHDAHAVFQIAGRAGQMEFPGEDRSGLIGAIGRAHVRLETRPQRLR